MKKKVLSILGVLLISISTLTGCAKCIDKKEESVKVTVVNEYYKPKEIRFTGMVGKIDETSKILHIVDRKIPLHDIYNMEGEILDDL